MNDKIDELSEALKDYNGSFEHLMKVADSHPLFKKYFIDTKDNNGEVIKCINNMLVEEKEELQKLEEEYFPNKER